MKWSAIWRQHFSASCLGKKHKQTRDCLIDIMYMWTNKKSICVVILKIPLLGLTFLLACFLREFPVALEFFSQWPKSFVHRWDLTLKSQQRPKSNINLLLIKQKWNYTFFILAYILLTRGSVRRIWKLVLGLQWSRSLWW